MLVKIPWRHIWRHSDRLFLLELVFSTDNKKIAINIK